MEAGFDFSELSDFQKDLLNLAKNTMPSETKKFMKKEAGKLARKAKAVAKRETKKKTGNYIKGFKAGKVYYFGGDLCCRAYNSAPHAHLVEYGHKKLSKGGKDLGFTPGKYPLKKASDSFENEFAGDLETFIDDVLDKGLS